MARRSEAEENRNGRGALGRRDPPSRRQGTVRRKVRIPFTESDLTPTAMRLLEAARRVYEKSGVHALSYEAIGREAKLSPGLIRYHFGNKGELLVALSAWLMMEGFSSDAWRSLRNSVDSGPAVDILLQGSHDVLSDPGPWKLFFDLLPAMLHDAHARGRLADLYRGIIEPAAAKLGGADAEESRRFVHMTVALVDGVALQLLADPDSVDVEKDLALWRECLEWMLKRHGNQVARD